MGKTLEEIKKEIEEGNNLKLRTAERVLSLREQYKDKLGELKSLGLDNPNDISSEINKLEKEINELKFKIESELPSDIIKEYKNKEFSKEIDIDKLAF